MRLGRLSVIGLLRFLRRIDLLWDLIFQNFRPSLPDEPNMRFAVVLLCMHLRIGRRLLDLLLLGYEILPIMIDRNALGLTCLIPNYHSLVHFISLGFGRATGLLWLHFLARAAKRDFFLGDPGLMMLPRMLFIGCLMLKLILGRVGDSLILGEYLGRLRWRLLLFCRGSGGSSTHFTLI